MPILKPLTVLGLHFFKHSWVDDLKRDQTQNYTDFTHWKNTAVDNSHADVCCYVHLVSLIIHKENFHTAIFTSEILEKVQAITVF